MLAPLLLAAATAALPPISPWYIENRDDICVLSRYFGTADQRIGIGFQPIFDTPQMELLVITPEIGGKQFGGQAQVMRKADGGKFGGSYYSYPLQNGTQRLTRISLDRALYDGLGRTPELHIVAKPIDLSVRVGKFEQAPILFRECEDRLLAQWGLDPKARGTGTPPEPLKPMWTLFGPNNIPDEARSKGYSGRVRAALVVGADGTVQRCQVMAQIGTLFTGPTCQQARKARFKPGTDAAGTPVPSLYVFSVVWSG